MGRTDEAFDFGQKAIQRTPRSFWVLKAVGDTWRDRGDHAQAIRCYDRGLAIAPHDTMLMNGKAKALYAEMDFEAAAAIYDRITDLRPDDHFAWLNLALALEQLGKRANARAAYNHALSLRPDSADALEGRASTAQSREEADAYLARLEAIEPARAATARARYRAP
jgi:tetratricopeptide (TPR) repeat protein